MSDYYTDEWDYTKGRMENPDNAKKSPMGKFWCFTVFDTNWRCNTTFENNSDAITYICGKWERCPETGRPHFQGYAEILKNCRLGQFQALLGLKGQCYAKLRYKTSSAANCIGYCKKERTKLREFEEYGVCSAGQGARNDIKEYVEAIKEGGIRNLVDKFPEAILKYGNKVDKLINLIDQKDISCRNSLEVIIHLGEPGTGKTRFIYDNHDINDVYELNIDKKDIWFENYNGQKILAINDFQKDSLNRNALLKILDIYPYQCPIKGSSGYAKWTKVYITSNYSVYDWFDREDLALLRRIHKVRFFYRNTFGINMKEYDHKLNQTNSSILTTETDLPKLIEYFKKKDIKNEIDILMNINLND